MAAWVLLTLPPLGSAFHSFIAKQLQNLPWLGKMDVSCLTLPHQGDWQRNLKYKRATVYVANHASYIDTLILISLLPADTRLIGKKELFTLQSSERLQKNLVILRLIGLTSPKAIKP